MTGPTLTAVIVPVAPADAVVADERDRYDRAAAWGVPAHITVLFPFVPPRLVTAALIGRLAETFSAASAFDCTFAECRWFGDDVLWLAPEAPQAFRDLTAAVVERFPSYLPYEGQFDDVVPHLTVGATPQATTKQLQAAEAAVTTRLPVSAHIDHALLIAGTDAPDSWFAVADLPLGAAVP